MKTKQQYYFMLTNSTKAINRTKVLKEIYNKSITTAKQNYLLFGRMNLLFITFIIIINYFTAIMVIKYSISPEIQNLIYPLATVPLMAYFIGGFLYFYHSFIRGVSSTTNQIFRGYRWYFRVLWVSYLIYGLYSLGIKITFDFFDYSLLIQLRIIFGFILALWFFIRSFFVAAIFLEGETNLINAFDLSFKLTRNNFKLTSQFILTGVSFIVLSHLLIIGPLFSMGVVALTYFEAFDYCKKTIEKNIT